MKISIGIEKDKTLIKFSWMEYNRVGLVSFIEIFNYPIYARIGHTISLFNGRVIF